jgi:FdhE protein
LSSQITPPTLLVPDSQLFAKRAARLRVLADGHSLGPWLICLSALCQAQQTLSDALPAAPPHPDSAGLPWLSASESILLESALHACLALCTQLAAAGVISTTEATALTKTTVPDWQALLVAALARARQACSAERWSSAEMVAAAAVQTVWQHAARQFTPMADSPEADNAVQCPCCGSLPIGSVVMAGDGKAGFRYQECSLCGTRWHAVRAQCTLCGDSRDLHYLGLEGAHPAIKAEACSHCHGYVKVFSQIQSIDVEPAADDLASLALDVLVGENGFGRASPNLFMNDGEPVS